ncbi:hypothetical protein BGX34_007352, partial [Mortierella sp. NVP85]
MVEREAVRLGVQFQVGGKWCSFVATETRKERDDDATLNEIGVEVEGKDKESREIIIVKETENPARRRSSWKRFSPVVSHQVRTLGYSLPPPAPLALASPLMYCTSNVVSMSLSAAPMPSQRSASKSSSISLCATPLYADFDVDYATQSSAAKSFSGSSGPESQHLSSTFTSAQAFPRGTGAASFGASSGFDELGFTRARGVGEGSDAFDAFEPLIVSPNAPRAFSSAASALETFGSISHAPVYQAFRSTPSVPEAPRYHLSGAFGSAAPGAFGSAAPGAFGSAAPGAFGSTA